MRHTGQQAGQGIQRQDCHGQAVWFNPVVDGCDQDQDRNGEQGVRKDESQNQDSQQAGGQLSSAAVLRHGLPNEKCGRDGQRPREEHVSAFEQGGKKIRFGIDIRYQIHERPVPIQTL